jgi:hypothetical protein
LNQITTSEFENLFEGLDITASQLSLLKQFASREDDSIDFSILESGLADYLRRESMVTASLSDGIRYDLYATDTRTVEVLRDISLLRISFKRKYQKKVSIQQQAPMLVTVIDFESLIA